MTNPPSIAGQDSLEGLIAKLRDGGNGLFHTHPLGDYGVCDEAADTIVRLRDALTECRLIIAHLNRGDDGLLGKIDAALTTTTDGKAGA